jgi:hypothetical protein
MPKQILLNNLEYLRKSNGFTSGKMDVIMGYKSKLYDHIKNDGLYPTTKALKKVFDNFKISINALCRIDIKKQDATKIRKEYNSIQALLKQK